MNQHDTENLKFILALSADQFDVWFSSLSNDDADYAMELLEMARAEVTLKVAELNDEPVSLNEAKNVLGKFTLKGKV
jgi:hypothetical protein